MSSYHQHADLISNCEDTVQLLDSSIPDSEIHAAIGEDAPKPLKELLMHATRIQHKPQQAIYHQGSRSDAVYFITNGLLKLIAHLPNGRARIVRLHRPRSVIGLSSLLGQVNDHTAVTVTKLNTLRLPENSLQRLRKEDPFSYVWLVECWYAYLQEADTWITQFSTGPIRGRVARLLAFLSGFEPEHAANQVQLLTCEEMGSILGVTSESVSRIIAEFKRQNILHLENNKSIELYTTDTVRLRQIAEE